jgi:Cof subfamily protein (haloacid dehalogenase superfamily)
VVHFRVRTKHERAIGCAQMARAYDALVLDIDGTLLDEQERVPARTHAALDRARAAGVVVMLATGRSHMGTREVMELLQLDAPSIVFNGAALYCRHEDRLIEHYALAEDFVADLLAYAEHAQLLPVVAVPDGQYAREPRLNEAPDMLAGFRVLNRVPHAELPRTPAIRVTMFSDHHPSSDVLYSELRAVVGDRPAYYTHFGLAALAGFRQSATQVVDVQPDCAGKAEALRVLQSRYGIPAERVVAVGDASNDLPILRAAGLGVAMGNASEDAKQAAKRIIGSNDSAALSSLIEELFLDGSAA